MSKVLYLLDLTKAQNQKIYVIYSHKWSNKAADPQIWEAETSKCLVFVLIKKKLKVFISYKDRLIEKSLDKPKAPKTSLVHIYRVIQHKWKETIIEQGHIYIYTHRDQIIMLKHTNLIFCMGMCWFECLAAVGRDKCLHVLFSGGQTLQLIMQWEQYRLQSREV